MQVSKVGASSFIPQILRDTITCPSHRYILAHKSTYTYMDWHMKGWCQAQAPGKVFINSSHQQFIQLACSHYCEAHVTWYSVVIK